MTVRVVEYRVDGGEVIRLLTDLLDVDAYPAADLAALYHERWEAESAYRQIKTFRRGTQQVLRSAGPELIRQEVWAHLAVHHCLAQIVMRLAQAGGLDPDRICFVKVLKHVRRSVIRQCVGTSVKLRMFLTNMAARVGRKLDNGVRRLREADRVLKRPESKYGSRCRTSRGHPAPRPTRRVPQKIIEPATVA